ALLSELAHDFFTRDELFFTKESILEYIQVFLSDTAGNVKFIDIEAVLGAIAIQQGILVERAADIYSFSHLTLQEYLTAKYISQDNRRIEKLIADHLTDERWQEIFLLVAGLKDDAGELLKLMEKATQKLTNTNKLEQLLIWAQSIANDTSPYFNPVDTRAIAIAYALSYNNADTKALAYALAKVKALANAYPLTNAYPIGNVYAYALVNVYPLKYFIEYARWSEEFQIYRDVNYSQLISKLEELEQQIPNNSAGREVRKAFALRIIQTWLEAFHLKPEMVDLSKQEIAALDNYFYGNLLMVKCKNAAVRVSKETWQNIESRMLLPVKPLANK
ncbi:MAG: histidine kinase, partial [Cyanobacteria bacterium J06558_2]